MVDLNITLPEGFLDEEVRCGYTVTSEMKRIWAVELDLAQQLLDVCKRNDIQIMTFAGTTLGAIRHKGFIPWDDDIDFIICRSEYDKLCDVATREFQHPYFFQTEYSDPGSMRGHAQLRNSETTGILNNGDVHYRFNQGIFIDIFPVDRIPDDPVEFQTVLDKAMAYKKRYQKLSRLTTRYYLRPDGNSLKNLIKRAAHPAVSMADAHFKLGQHYYRRYEETLSSYDGVDTKRCGTISFLPYEERFYFSTDSVAETVEMPFEFLTFPVPTGWDEQLTNAYGDYNKFVIGGSVHGNVLFDTNVPYTRYLNSAELKMGTGTL